MGGTINGCDYSPLQYNLLAGDVNGGIHNITPGTTGQYLLSGGGSAYPTWSSATLPIAAGGTNATSYTNTAGIVVYNGTSFVTYSGVNVSTGGVYSNTNQPAFIAYASGNLSNVTGDGTDYLIILDTTIVNQATAYNTSTGVFTAPVTGIYQFSATIYAALTASDTSLQGYFKATSDNVYFADENTSAILVSSDFVINGSAFIKMTANDTCSLHVIANGAGSKDASVLGTRNFTYFSAFLVG